jgi:hypothetical protein
MIDYRDQIQSIYEFLSRSEEEQTNPYAYEIFLLTGSETIALTSRTSGTAMFDSDMEKGVAKAKQMHGVLKVEVFGGKSRNAKKINTYKININGNSEPKPEPVNEVVLRGMIKEEMQHIPKQTEASLGEVNNLIGMLSGNSDNPQLNGMLGIIGTITNSNKELDRLNYQKQIDDFKYESKFNNLQEKYERLRTENAELRVEKDHTKKENVELKFEVNDLTKRLEAYTPNELMKRTAIGVISNIGSKILGNSPKTAELFGLTPNELQGALGLLETSPNQTEDVANVEVEQVGNVAQTPEEKNKQSIIKNLSDALQTMELPQVAKIVNMVGLSIDKPEFIDRTLQFLNQLINNNSVEENIEE